MITDEEMDRRLREIAAIAKKQAIGPYTPQSDAVQALKLIELMAMLLIEEHEARHGAIAPTKDAGDFPIQPMGEGDLCP